MHCNIKCNITHQDILVNNYVHLTLATPTSFLALPGQYIYIENHPVYMMDQQGEKLEILVPLSLVEDNLKSKFLYISSPQGNILLQPSLSQFILVIVEDGGLPACIFYLKKYRTDFSGLIFIGAEKNFPFTPCPSRQLISNMPTDIIAGIPLLEDWKIPHRLACMKEQPGVFHGAVNELASLWQKEKLEIKQLVISKLNNLIFFL